MNAVPLALLAFCIITEVKKPSFQTLINLFFLEKDLGNLKRHDLETAAV